MSVKKISIKDRQGYIGGSEISAVCGLNRWQTPLKTFALKKGLIEPDDLSENEAVELGTELEDFICKKFERKTGKKVRRHNLAYVHPEHEFLVGHVDRIIEGSGEIIEAKNISAWRAKEFKDEEIAPEYLMQLQWYLGLAGQEQGYLVLLIGGQKFVIKNVTFDKELFDDMVKGAIDFWNNYVLKDIAPVAVIGDRDTLAALYPEEKTDRLFVEGKEAIKLAGKCIQRNSIKEIIKEEQKNLEIVENEIKELIKETEGLETEYHVITWKSQRVAPFLDTRKMKSDGIYAEYELNNQNRVLRVREKKEEG